MNKVGRPRSISSTAIIALETGPKSSLELVVAMYGNVNISAERLDAVRRVISRLRKRDNYNIIFDTVSKRYVLKDILDNKAPRNFFTCGRVVQRIKSMEYENK